MTQAHVLLALLLSVVVTTAITYPLQFPSEESDDVMLNILDDEVLAAKDWSWPWMCYHYPDYC